MTTSRHNLRRIFQRAFPGISPTEWEIIANNSQLRSYPADSILCHENSIEETFYLILEGEVEVTKAVNELESGLITHFYAGDYFGEMALVQSAPRAATVRSITPLKVLEMDKQGFDHLLRSSRSVSRAMVREISLRVKENDKMAIDDLRMRASELALAYRKLAEQELTRREFLTDIAHQLRAPLIAAGGYIQLIQKGAVSSKNLKVSLETLSRQITHIATLVNDILFLQEMDLIMGRFQPVDMLEIAQNVVDRYTKKTKKQPVRISIESDPDLPVITGDPKQLEHALMILLDNAVKLGLKGGRTVICLEREKEQLVVSINEQGGGIPRESMPLLFDRSYQIEHSNGHFREGLGLALSIARQVIEQHNGRLEIQTEPGKGCTFKIGLNIWSKEKA